MVSKEIFDFDVVFIIENVGNVIHKRHESSDIFGSVKANVKSNCVCIVDLNRDFS